MTQPKRVIVQVVGGCADACMDDGVEWELIDWDTIRNGDGRAWTTEDINRLAEWGNGLVPDHVIAELREYADWEDK